MSIILPIYACDDYSIYRNPLNLNAHIIGTDPSRLYIQGEVHRHYAFLPPE